MTKEFLGLGWKFPVNIGLKGKIAASKYEEDISEAIWIILSTSKGERVMRPDFGCGIHDFIFDYINITTMKLIEESVREALILWEPRIKLISVNVSAEGADDGELSINIDYIVRTTNNQFNMVYPFYLMEGG